MKKYFGKIFIFLALSLFLFLPVLNTVNAAALKVDGKDANTGFVYVCDPPGQCDFNDLMLAVQKVVKWAVTFALAFSVVIIAIAGWTYLTSGGEPAKRKKANDMFVSVGWGILAILSAWLIVNLIMTKLVNVGTGPNQVQELIKN